MGVIGRGSRVARAIRVDGDPPQILFLEALRALRSRVRAPFSSGRIDGPFRVGDGPGGGADMDNQFGSRNSVAEGAVGHPEEGTPPGRCGDPRLDRLAGGRAVGISRALLHAPAPNCLMHGIHLAKVAWSEEKESVIATMAEWRWLSWTEAADTDALAVRRG